jgi:hypothetical protein
LDYSSEVLSEEEVSPLAGVGELGMVGQVESLCLEAKVPSSSAEEAVAKVALQGREVAGREFGSAGYWRAGIDSVQLLTEKAVRQILVGNWPEIEVPLAMD